MAPIFLGLDEVLEVHRNQIELYGGSHGIRDRGLLQSAIATPAAGFGGQFLHEDLQAMAAAYVYHIVQNHPFVDGNKRTGAVAAFVFLELNGIELKAPQPDYEALVFKVAEGNAEKEEIVITRHGKPAGLLVGFRSEDDWFDYKLEHDPRFLKRIEQARQKLRQGQGVKLEEVED